MTGKNIIITLNDKDMMMMVMMMMVMVVMMMVVVIIMTICTKVLDAKTVQG